MKERVFKHLNRKSRKNLSYDFSVFFIKFDQKRYCTLSFCHTGLCEQWSMREGSNSLFRKAILRTWRRRNMQEFFIF